MTFSHHILSRCTHHRDATRVNQYFWDGRVIRTNNLMQFDTSWMRVRRQVRAVTLYMAYLGQQKTTTKRTVNMTVFAIDSEILAARWYNVSWDSNTETAVPNFDWRAAGLESRMQRVGSLQVVLNQQREKLERFTRSQYVPVRLNPNWFNRFLSQSSRRTYTLVLRPTEDTETEIQFNNMWAHSHAPGGLAPFLRFVPSDRLCNGVRV